MFKKSKRIISLILCMIMCFSCSVFASEPTNSCTHIKGELNIDINSENICKSLLDLAGNKEEDIDLFFYNGPLDIYYQEEELYRDSKDGFIEDIYNEIIKNTYFKEIFDYYVSEEFPNITKNDRVLLERETYQELKEDIEYNFEDYYMTYPYLYKGLKDLEYKSIKIVYDIYTYLPNEIKTDVKMNIYILSDDINNSITIPVHFIVDEKGVLINSDIVLTLFDIASRIEPSAKVPSIEYRNLLVEQLINIDYLEITFEDTDIEEFEVFTENKEYFEKHIEDLLKIFNEFNFNKYIQKNNEVYVNSEELENMFIDFLIYGYKNYDSIFESVKQSLSELYENVLIGVLEEEGYSKEEIIEEVNQIFNIDEETKAEIDFGIKGQIYILLNALNVSSENESIKKDLETIYNKLKEIETKKYEVIEREEDGLSVCYEEVDDCIVEPMNCMPYYRYTYDTIDEYIYEELLDVEVFELFAFLKVIKDKTRNSYINSKNSIDVLNGTINFNDELKFIYEDCNLINITNKYSIDNKENKVITTEVSKKCDYNKVEYMIQTVENVICPINEIQIAYPDNYDYYYIYNWCDIEETHFDSSITYDYGVKYELVDGSFYIESDYINACYNLKLVEKEIDGVKYFVTISNGEEILLGHYENDDCKYLKVRDLEKLGYEVDYERARHLDELTSNSIYRIGDYDNIITIYK